MNTCYCIYTTHNNNQAYQPHVDKVRPQFLVVEKELLTVGIMETGYIAKDTSYLMHDHDLYMIITHLSYMYATSMCNC